MLSNNEELIAVIGATGQQGGAVVRALQATGQFMVRALTRNPGKHRELADEVSEADLNRPKTLKAAFEGAHGVFLVNEILGTLNRQGHKFSVKQIPKEVFPEEIAGTFRYFQAHSYLGSDSYDQIALANKIAGGQPSKFSTWARLNVPVQTP